MSDKDENCNTKQKELNNPLNPNDDEEIIKNSEIIDNKQSCSELKDIKNEKNENEILNPEII